MEACHEKWFSLLTNMQEPRRAINFPLAMPGRLPRINPKFRYHEPSTLDRMFPFAVPFRNGFGRWRRRVLSGAKPVET
jgi:hypothetical protein